MKSPSRSKQLYTSLSVRIIPSEDLAARERSAVNDERFEDAAVIREEIVRRKELQGRPKEIEPVSTDRMKRRLAGPYMVWFGWLRPVSKWEITSGKVLPTLPYITFATYEEAKEWFDANCTEETAPKDADQAT